jgi:hypothetical protein
VLPLPVAEMDFPLAAPIAEALHAAIRRSARLAPVHGAPTVDLPDRFERTTAGP